MEPLGTPVLIWHILEVLLSVAAYAVSDLSGSCGKGGVFGLLFHTVQLLQDNTIVDQIEAISQIEKYTYCYQLALEILFGFFRSSD